MKKVTPKKKGRLMKYTEQQVGKALIKAHGFVSIAAKKLKCAPKTVYEYIERYPALRHVVSESRENTLDLAESKLIEAIEGGEAWAICFFLKTQGKKRGYIERSEHDHNPDDKPIKFTMNIGTIKGTIKIP